MKIFLFSIFVNIVCSGFFCVCIAGDLKFDPSSKFSLMQRIPYSTAFIETTYLSKKKVQNTIHGTGFFYIHHEEVGPTVIRIPGPSDYPEGTIDAYFDRPVNDRMCIDKCNGINKLYLITNKHVLKGKKLCGMPLNIKLRLNFLYNAKNYRKKAIVKCDEVSISQQMLTDIPDILLEHPGDSDLCSIDISQLIKDYEDQHRKKLLYYAYTKELLASHFREFELYDDIAMIGYPRGLYDTVHNLPILRGGKISSVPLANWNGKPEFMIDCACIPGSSGSPVLLIRTTDPVITSETIHYVSNISIDEAENNFITEAVGGGDEMENLSYVQSVDFEEESQEVITEWESGYKTITLLGILHGGPMWSAAGEIIQTSSQSPTENYSIGTRIPINLGLVIKAPEIHKIVR